MDKTIFRFLAVALAVIMFAGCGSSYSKLLKSKNHDKMYTEGLRYYKARKYQKAIQLFEQIDPYTEGTLRADTVKFYTASAYYNQGDFETSGILLDQFRRSYGRNSVFLEESEYLYAMGFFYSSPPPERDQTNTIKAMMSIHEYLDRYPNSPKKDDMLERTKELQGKLYDKEFLNAKCYYNIGKYKSAVVALRNTVDKSPENPHREEMMYLVAKSSYLLAVNSIPDLQRDRYLKMMDSYLNFVSEYPTSKHSRELGKMMDEAKQFIAKHNTDSQDNQENTPANNGTKEK